jgi:hypothetical protein
MDGVNPLFLLNLNADRHLYRNDERRFLGKKKGGVRHPKRGFGRYAVSNGLQRTRALPTVTV